MMEWSETRHRLGLAPMDLTHQEFIERVNAASQASGAALVPAFRALLEHTEQHFAQEEAWMVETACPARDEHAGEHRRVLGDLRRFLARIEQGSSMMARAYLKEQVPGWFDLHASTMDAALAAHLKARGRA
ncbi:bacteriohemerythrin [Zoogloea sp.]|uniref:bacteriohemerythrin n=1 Tax=Zoogloea sp. TaxID=49181 RepID=UPI0035B320EC